MTFDEILAQVLPLLQREGRVSYRALKRRFTLDDEYLEDVKVELIQAKRLARDEEGAVLVWVGDAPTATVGAVAPVVTGPETQTIVPEWPMLAPDIPAAERRQLTVLFCDLVGSTALAGRLDPEDLREVVRAYQDTCARVIARFEGHIAQYLGDGLLVYFGYPLAHEDDAQRAVRTGLGMLEALVQLNTRLEQKQGVCLAVRLGVHSGLVVVGEVGGGSRQAQLALGETPNLAARLQGLAAPNTLVISAATLPLLGGFFACQSLGVQPLQGVAQPLEVYQVLSESTARSRLDVASSTGLTPIVSREQEVALLQERWAQVKEGVGQMVLLSGEAGIGKSRLVQELQAHVASEPQAWLTPCQCSPYYQHTALHPWIDLLERVALRFERDETLPQKSGLLQEQEERYALTGPLPPLAIPATLHDSLMARLDRLATVKGLAQLGATLGREFAYELLQAVSPWDEATVHQGLHQLVEAEFLYQRGLPPQATYIFKHALIQDAAYQSLLRSTRQQYHQRIAQVLEQQFPETNETQPELLAHHATEAGLSEQALGYWQRAGQQALQRSAHVEAISHLSHGLEVLSTLPETPERIMRELVLQNTLGQALIATKGYGAAEVERVYSRARELSHQVGDTAQVFPVLYGVWVFHYIRSEFSTAQEIGEDMLQLAQQQDDPAPLLVAHRLVGTILFFLGELIEARRHLEQTLALYDPQQHRVLALHYSQDIGVTSFIFLSWTLWLMGYPDQALSRAHEALALARNVSHPHSLAFALNLIATMHQFRREAHATLELAEAAIALCREQGFAFWLAYGMRIRNMALTVLRPEEVDMPQMHQELESAGHMRTY